MLVREVALVNGTGAMDPAAFAFCAEACRIQLERDFLPAWHDFLAVKRPVTVVGYSSTTDLAPGSFSPIVISKVLDREDVLGDHSGLEIGDVAWGRALPIESVISHEVVELVADPYGTQWIRLKNGTVVADEPADMVELDSYEIVVTLGGQTRSVPVSNFAYPAWFDLGGGQKFDHMGLCSAPGENRGYMIVAGPDGKTENVFAATATPEYRARVEAKVRLTDSRTARRSKTTPYVR